MRTDSLSLFLVQLFSCFDIRFRSCNRLSINRSQTVSLLKLFPDVGEALSRLFNFICSLSDADKCSGLPLPNYLIIKCVQLASATGSILAAANLIPTSYRSTRVIEGIIPNNSLIFRVKYRHEIISSSLILQKYCRLTTG